jgi:hypothetical protein
MCVSIIQQRKRTTTITTTTTSTTTTTTTTWTNTSIMAPDSRSTSPVRLTVHEPEETFSYQDAAHIISCLDSANTPWPEVPQKEDILLGRHREAYGHPGNRRFRFLISSYSDDYQNARARDTKTGIIQKIVASIQKYGGRFLRRDEQTDMWCDVCDDYKYVHEKVSHALRQKKNTERRSPQKMSPNANDHPPTPEQDNYFQTLLADQQNIFRELIDEDHTSENFEVD